MRTLVLIALGTSMLLAASNGAILPSTASGTIDVQFPVSDYYQQYAAQGGNPRPTTGRLVIVLPPNFHPTRPWPILVVTSTNDNQRSSPQDVPFYRAAAQAEGWIVLATDATIRPRHDNVTWRLAILAAGLDVVHRDWPGSAKWPIAFAGHSGGAKASGWMGAMLARTGSPHICGFFFSGMNQDRLSVALRDNPPTRGFFQIPVWISSGSYDPIAPPSAAEAVRASLTRTGFRNVQLSQFSGGHQVDRADLQRALKWFRTLASSSFYPAAAVKKHHASFAWDRSKSASSSATPTSSDNQNMVAADQALSTVLCHFWH